MGPEDTPAPTAMAGADAEPEGSVRLAASTLDEQVQRAKDAVERLSTEEGHRQAYLAARMRADMRQKDSRERGWRDRVAEHAGKDISRVTDVDGRAYQAARRAQHERDYDQRSPGRDEGRER